MKVKDLIQALEGMDPEATVIVRSNNFEHNGADIALSYANQYDTGSKKEQTFRDAFDGDSYTKETWSIIGGEEKVVSIG